MSTQNHSGWEHQLGALPLGFAEFSDPWRANRLQDSCSTMRRFAVVRLTALLLVFVAGLRNVFASKHTWTVRRDWNALGTHGTRETVKDLESCMSKAKGHAQFSFAQDSKHCYYSDGTSFDGEGDDHVTSGCVAQKVKNCGGPASDDWWTVTTDWNALGTSGERKDAEDLAKCLKLAHGHAQFSYAKDSGHCYFSDSKKFEGKSGSSVTSGCVAAEVKDCAPDAPAVCSQAEKDWPTFATSADLSGSSWGAYFKDLYGQLPPDDQYPLKISDWWFLYGSLVKAHGVKLPKSTGRCPPPNCALNLFDENNRYCPANTQWIWHPPPYAAFADSTWVEVMHEQDPFGDEKIGAWFVHAKGSGVWYNIGRSISFKEHSDAYAHFNANGNEDMCRAAASAGYDTVQFTEHVDHVNYPCDRIGGYPFMNIEIVAVKLQGTYSCGADKAPDDNTLRSGWANQKCKCDNSLEFANCGRSLLSAAQRGSSLQALQSTVQAHCSLSTPKDPHWFAECNRDGGCMRIAVASSMHALVLSNASYGTSVTNGFMWCIDRANSIIYTKLVGHPSRSAAFFSVTDAASSDSCKFLALRRLDGDHIRVYTDGPSSSSASGLTCSLEWNGTSDPVANVSLHVQPLL